MNIVTTILVLIAVVNGIFAITLVRDLAKNKDSVMKEPGNPIVMAITEFFMFLLSTFGISDFAIGAAIYPKSKWVSDEKLPGTLNTQCVIPVAVMALSYISVIEVDLTTLLVAIFAQVLGAYISPRYVVKLPVNTIKKFVATGLIIAGGLIVAGKVGLYPAGGTATGLSGFKLVLLGVLSFVYGAVNNIGIGSYALTSATVYALGMSPLVAFPIMMGACTFSVPIGSMQFIKLDSYSRKITLFAAIFGSLGVLVAVFVVQSLDVALLQWVVVAVVLFSATQMILSVRKGA
ncbi:MULTISPECIES: sulfite exporter TauE/SafE family protein [Erysipelothrix]|uniref:sulfite exporter TauE/SafE family protein n=1 Tax=Erysipelothrix TaxID=1647 RepID=UPI00135AD053|nr:MULTISPECIES: sulfite exporter TauE/SafE family protein [Erysipelothrix]